jgi:hypothetical protein
MDYRATAAPTTGHPPQPFRFGQKRACSAAGHRRSSAACPSAGIAPWRIRRCGRRSPPAPAPLERLRLTPEGFTLAEMLRLTRRPAAIAFVMFTPPRWSPATRPTYGATSPPSSNLRSYLARSSATCTAASSRPALKAGARGADAR